MKMENHFALPLNIERGNLIWEGGHDGQDVAEFASEERAAAAAHAINCHDELVEALERLRDRYDDMLFATGSGHEYAARVIAHADAILTKAKGEAS